MTALRMRAVGLPILAALTVLLAGCGAGGFANKDTAQPDHPISNYVALGDGFAAAPYVGPTTSKDGCLRSAGNYPARVAELLSVTSVTDVSCVGATTEAIAESFRATGAKRKVPAQLDAITKDTDLVTVGVGIEDGNLLGSLFRICSEVPCGADVGPKDLVDQLKLLGTNLPIVLRAIQSRAPQAYIVVVGYPDLIPSKADCKAVPPTNATQFGYANTVFDQLNATLRGSARQTGAAYIDVAELSASHTACSTDPWVNSFTTVPGKKLAYHPVAAEQKAVADAIAAQVRAR